MWFSRNATRPRYRVAEAAELHLHRRSLVLEAGQNLDEAAQRRHACRAGFVSNVDNDVAAQMTVMWF